MMRGAEKREHTGCGTITRIWILLALSLCINGYVSASFLSPGLTYSKGRLPIFKTFPLYPTCYRSSSLSVVSKDPIQESSSKRTKRKRKKPLRNKKIRRSNSPQTWRIFGVEVHPDKLQLDLKEERQKSDIPVNKRFLHPAVLESLYERLRLSQTDLVSDVQVVRRSLDARHKRRSDGSTGPRFVYVLDVELKSTDTLRLKHQPGRAELLSTKSKYREKQGQDDASSSPSVSRKSKVVIVGAGPAGLFCALSLARQGIQPVLLERGQPVENRGKDIGALMHRRSLDAESNFCFGEGGAGTWSDGKLTTRIGRNSNAVRYVLETLVEYGAPETILVDGAPHLGTDNLVRLLRNMRTHLRQLGGEIRFGTKMTKLIIEGGVAVGVRYTSKPAVERNVNHPVEADENEESGQVYGDAVVLATGHSARDVYERLHDSGVQLEAKGFAVGFRVEHPQKLINKIQYGTEWGPSVVTGKVPTDAANQQYFDSAVEEGQVVKHHQGKLPVPSYRLATDQAFDGDNHRGVYSFCMCPGGQIVPASTDPEEVCVNGMSFSRRDSLWANSALVVTVASDDPVLIPYREKYGVLAGVAFQRDMERRAAEFGGGNLTVPVQRAPDFLAGQPSMTAPSSSYRLGVKPCACHEIYPPPLTLALRSALIRFDQHMPGFVCDEALLHGVETRTSSPVRLSRDGTSMQALGVKNLFPAGEGAGFAGGIVSAAVDGIVVAEAILDALDGQTGRDSEEERSKVLKNIGTYY